MIEEILEGVYSCQTCGYKGVKALKIDRKRYCPMCDTLGMKSPLYKLKLHGSLQKRGFSIAIEQYEWLCKMGVASKVLRKVFDWYRTQKFVTKTIDLENGNKRELTNRMFTISPEHIEWLKKFDDPNDLVRTLIDAAIETEWRYYK